MRKIRIFQPGDYKVNDLLELSSEAGQHVGVVLRMQADQFVTLFRGDNREFEALLVRVHKKKVLVKIVSDEAISRESPCALHLLQGISRGERMEVVVQKAVELGVNSIRPLITERCAVKLNSIRLEKKCQQWQAIAIAACEQSGRNYVPKIHAPVTLVTYLQDKAKGLHLVLAPETDKTWRDYDFKQTTLSLFIGPEGGWSSNELHMMIAEKTASLSLGPRILRTETAAIAALSILQAVCGDL